MSRKENKSLKKRMLDILIAVAATYVFLLAILFFAQRSMMYFPDTKKPVPSEWGIVDYVPVKVTASDGINLDSWFFPSPAKTNKVIVMFHGNGGSFVHRLYKLPYYLNEGYGVLLAEYRGYGGNSGKPYENGLYQDARAFLDWLIEERGVLQKNIILHGESLGTGVAVQMATEYDVAAVVLESAYDSTVNVAKKRYFFVPVKWLMKDQYRSVDKIDKIRAPVLLVHGEEDNIIPKEFAENLYTHAPEPKTFKVIPQAGHNDLYNYGAPLHVVEFLRTID